MTGSNGPYWQHPDSAGSQPWRLPSPPHWPAPDHPGDAGRPGQLSTGFAAGMVGAAIAGAVGLFSGVSGMGPVFVPFWILGLRYANTRAGAESRPQATSNQNGTTLTPSRARFRAISIAIAVMCVAGIGYALLVLLGADVPGVVGPSPYYDRSRSFFFSDALMAGGVGIMMVPAILWAWKRWTQAYLNLSPIGFHLNEVPVRAARWEDVVDVLDFIPWHDPAEPALPQRIRSMRNVVLVLRDRSLKIIRSPEIYAPNPAAVFWMVRNYWLHPEQRVELTNGVAVNRLAREDFPCA